MMNVVLALLGAGITMLVLDGIWLSTMISVYRQFMGDLLSPDLKLEPAAAFYVLYVIGVVWLAVLPSLTSETPIRTAALTGAVLGLVAYGTYDLTNQATLRNWPLTLTLMDMAWGTFLTALAAASGAAAVAQFGSVR